MNVIEKYEIATNQWVRVRYSLKDSSRGEVEMKLSSLTLQINESQILILGGIDKIRGDRVEYSK